MAGVEAAAAVTALMVVEIVVLGDVVVLVVVDAVVVADVVVTDVASVFVTVKVEISSSVKSGFSQLGENGCF